MKQYYLIVIMTLLSFLSQYFKILMHRCHYFIAKLSYYYQGLTIILQMVLPHRNMFLLSQTDHYPINIFQCNITQLKSLLKCLHF